MKKQIILVPILTAIMLSGSLIANADNTTESINSTAQKAPEKRAGQPTSADTNITPSTSNNVPSEAVIESSKTSTHSGSGRSSTTSTHTSGGTSTNTNGESGSSATTNSETSGVDSQQSSTSEVSTSVRQLLNDYPSQTVGDHTTKDGATFNNATAGEPKETTSDRVKNAQDHMTDAQRRAKTRKAKIAVAQATLKYEAAKKAFKNQTSDGNKAKLRVAIKNLNRAQASLLKILI